MEYAVFLVLLLYLLPWLVASAHDHPRAHWILALVVLGGWTGVGWLTALVWAWRGRPRVFPPLQLAIPTSSPTSRWRRARRPLAVGSLALASAVGVGWSLSLPPERSPISGVATVLAATAPVHRGPGEHWPTLGALAAPCQVSLLERAGSWRRVWRTDGCSGSMSGNAGWLRAAHLTRVAELQRATPP